MLFHPMIDEDAPFKSLVLAHYHKEGHTEVLAEMRGNEFHTFRRI